MSNAVIAEFFTHVGTLTGGIVTYLVSRDTRIVEDLRKRRYVFRVKLLLIRISKIYIPKRLVI